MKTLNETFTEEEWDELSEVKKKSGLSWHDFMIAASKAWEKENKK